MKEEGEGEEEETRIRKWIKEESKNEEKKMKEGNRKITRLTAKGEDRRKK